MNSTTAIERPWGAWPICRPALLAGLAMALAFPRAWAQAGDGEPPTLTLVPARDDNSDSNGDGNRDCDEFDQPSDSPDGQGSQPLPPATAGQPWAAQLQAGGAGDAALRWSLVKAPRGLTLMQDPPFQCADASRRERATLRWTPTAADLADNEVQVRVASPSGGKVLRSFTLAVAGGNHVPDIEGFLPQFVTEGQTLRLPVIVFDADDDALSISLRHLPPGARYDPARGLLTWTPGQGQAGEYQGIEIVASDGKHSATQSFGITVKPGQTPPAAPALKARAGFTLSHALDALDSQGHEQFWRVTSATHGAARMAGDGITLLFTPEAGYAGQASVTVQSDRSHAPLDLGITVNSARLLAIDLPPELLRAQRIGTTMTVRATADFEDEAGVPIDEPVSDLRLQAPDLAGMGYVGKPAIRLDAATGRVRFVAPGPALLVASRQDADGRVLRAAAALTAETGQEGKWPPAIQPVHVYPAALALPPGGARQIKVYGDDLNSGGFIDIHAASQTVFKGVPAHVEEFEDPDTGEIDRVQYDAIAPVRSGTRYFSGDERIATVSADGLVTAHAPGKVTIGVVHLRSLSFRDDGIIERQIAGQQNITLTVSPVQMLDGAAAIAVRQAEGGVVAAPTGETVLIGPGALAQDAAIGIRRIALADLARVTGIAAPADGILQPLGAFHLDAGNRPSAAPLQLAIPVQGGIAAQPDEEVLFLRKGRVMTEGGGHRDTWWLVDSGLAGADGVARTASLPGEGLNLPYGINLYHSQQYQVGPLYGGVIWSGDYVVMRRAPGVAGKLMSVAIEPGAWLDFGEMNLSLAGGMTGALIGSDTLGALASAAADLSAGRHQFGVTQTARVTLPPETPGQGIALRVYNQLPQPPYPWGKVSYPQFAKTPDAVSYDEASNTVNIKLAMTDTGPFTGTVILGIRSWFADGKNREIARFDGATLGDTIRVTPPPDLALADTRWQLVRQIPIEQIDNSGELRATREPLTFGSNDAHLERAESSPALVAGLTCTGVKFIRENKVVSEITLIDAPPDSSQCLTSPVQPMMDTPFWSLLYVGGAGKIYVIDLVKLQLVDTIVIPSGGNIASLMAAGSLLLIGEGGNHAGADGFRLLAMFIDPQSSRYHRNPIALKLPQLAASPLGVGGIAAGADGRTLVVAVSKPPAGGGAAASGQVWAFDLNSLNLKTGDIDPPVIAQGGDAGQLAAPLTITSTPGNPDRYLVRSASGQQTTLLLKRDASRKITEATLRGADANGKLIETMHANPLETRTNGRLPDRFTLTAPDDVKFAIVRQETRRSISTRACTCLMGQCECHDY